MQYPILRRLFLYLLLLPVLALPVGATWSIVAINMRTGEVAVASATCLERLDLRTAVPVIVVGQGAAAAQSFIDVDGSNRLLIWNNFMAGQTTPAQILTQLSINDPTHRTRQYGICAFTGPPVTFTGRGAGAAKRGVVGTIGDYAYAIQGNVLAGAQVVFAAETAFRDTNGDMGQRLMAGMEAARALGGDGRCSCSPFQPASCGVPPPNFTKSAHVAFVIVARIGDTDGACNARRGCAAGMYYLNQNVAGRNGRRNSPDPVIQLQAKYDTWRANKSGRPDAILSTVSSVQSLPADGRTTRTVVVRLVDVDGVSLTTGGATVDVTTANGLPALMTTSPVTDHGDGSYSFDLTAGTQVGTDTFVITADDGRKVTLYPFLSVRSDPVTGLHAGYDQVSVSAAPTVPFVVNVPGGAGGRFVLVGSVTGTQPGTHVGDVFLPLNGPLIAAYGGRLDLVLAGLEGRLDDTGRGEGTLALPAAVLGPLVGLRMDWSAVVIGPHRSAPTNPVGFDLVP